MIIDPTKEIRIYTKNCIDSDGTIASSHGGTTSYLCDRDNGLLWESSGARRDALPVTLTITFKVNGTETEFEINTLGLLNANIRALKAEYWNGSAYVDLFSNEEDGGIDFTHFGEITTSRIRLTLTKTVLPNREKQIGEIIIARLRYILESGATSYDLIYRDKQASYQFGNGAQGIAYTRALASRINRYGARVSFEMIPRTDYEKLLSLKDEGEPFLFQPEAVSSPEDIFLVNWTSAFAAKYSTLYKGNGYDLTMEVSEV